MLNVFTVPKVNDLKYSTFRLIIIIPLIWAVSSCSVKKFIPEGQHLSQKYSVKIVNKTDKIPMSELRGLIKPKPNSKFLIWKPKLYIHFRNLQKPTKFNTWLNKNYGEEPVYTYNHDLEKVKRNMGRYLSNIGFFNSDIIYDIEPNDYKDHITYHITPSIPYTISKINYSISDTTINQLVIDKRAKSLVLENSIYNAYTMDNERDRITEILRNSGYFYFSRNYIQFVVDSNYREHTMLVTLTINNIKEPTDVPGETIERKHDKYYINTVTVIPDFKPLEDQVFDTSKLNIEFWDNDNVYSYDFLYGPIKKLKPSAFNQALKIKPGETYSAEDVQNTYRRLFNYQIIRTANISFDTVAKTNNEPEKNLLDCKISMQKSTLHAFSIEAEGTNSSGDLGIRGNIIFLNKNIFRRAEVLRIRLNGGFEAQTISETDGSTGIFNTFEAGIEGSVFFPRFFSPIKLQRFNQRFNPTSNLTFGYNYQLRPNYSRNITLLNLGYSWNQNKKIRHIVTPANINYVKVNPTPEFEKELEEETNKRLKEQYSDHTILGLNYSFIHNNQKVNDIRNHEYFRMNIETSGNLLYGINTLFGTTPSNDGGRDYYEFFGVRYSQYIRVDFDFRQYFKFSNKKNTLATRYFVGLGVPYLNSEEIPYERGFYSGGANGMRGWVFRGLGPGSYSGTEQFERIGDLQLELNVEYRFPIYKFLHSAFFLDIGNIWTYNESETFPGGQFDINDFYKELAADFGIGVRFDFKYFIFRVDFATPVVDPAYPEGERWRFDYIQFKDVIGNFGIGYPF